MGLCSRCQRRKAKRFCPALQAELCSQCCGELREKSQNCPASCRHYLQHQTYQEKKKNRPQLETLELPQDPEELERLEYLIFNLEASLFRLARSQPGLNDALIYEAVTTALDELKRGRGRLILPGNLSSHRNPLSEYLLRVLDEVRLERKIIIPGELSVIRTEEKIKALSFLKAYIMKFIANRIDNGYLKDLINRLEKLAADHKPLV